jgi:uncharacterized Zn-finger protein
MQKPFGFEADLQRHILAKHSTEGKAAIRCLVDGCREDFSRKDNMLRHIKKDINARWELRHGAMSLTNM